MQNEKNNFDPSMDIAFGAAPKPEPVIGTGLILERGRERWGVSLFHKDTAVFRCERMARNRLGAGFKYRQCVYLPTEEIAEMLRAGWRVVRHANKENDSV